MGHSARSVHRGRKSILVAWILFGAMMAAATTALAGGSVARVAALHCTAPARLGNDSPPLGGVIARSMSCAAARAAMRRGKLYVHGCFGAPGPCASAFHTRGFHCQARPVGTVRCRAGRRSFSFGWSE